MRTISVLIVVNWPLVAIPATVFIASAIALLWLRKMALDGLIKWSKKINWSVGNTLIPSLKGPILLLCLILSIYLAVAVANIPAGWKSPVSQTLWSLFVIAIAITILNLVGQAILFYGQKFKMLQRVILITRNIVYALILAVAVLVILEVWGIPTDPLLLLVATIVFIAILAFKNIAPNFLASFQLAASPEIKKGDYIKLDTGEEGYITEISWNKTGLRALNEGTILVPNSVLLRRKVVYYGRPLKKAREPFYFNSQTHMGELTGFKASDLQELVDIVKKVPDSVIYYHTHHFLEENKYRLPELSNDFSRWVRDALYNDVLAEKLAKLNIFKLKSLASFRLRLVDDIEKYLAQDYYQRRAARGKEFYFMKSVSVIFPTNYVAYDLREFVEALRKISPASLYFHVFESHLHPGWESNDFTVWLEKSLGDPELSREVAGIDPYSLTLEGLRSSLVQIIEKRIQ